MSKLFLKNLREKVFLTAPEEEIIQGLLTTKKIRRKQYLLQAGDVCQAVAFVETGALKAYSVDHKGQEHIIRFGLEGCTISDFASFMSGEPSVYNIEALEDTEVIVIPKSAWAEVQMKVPKYEQYVQLQITSAYADMQERITALISLSPEERYNYFITFYPLTAQRVPQHSIASFLGLTPETLSRVRHRIGKIK